ncbi:MAG TPA: matrixin family metalloprotease [Mycobacteriales bacterium]
MKVRLVAALAITLATATGFTAAEAARPTVTLIDVHEIKAARNPAGPNTGAANCVNDGAATGKYVLTGWAVQGNKTALFNTTTLPSNLGLSATLSAFQSGYSVWSQASPAPTITVGTSTTSSLKPTANHQYELMFGKTGGTTLAVTYTWRWSNGEVESDTLFNTSFTWANLGAEGDGCYETAGNVYDVGNIATHEFGHTYGLDHPSASRFETMYAYGYSGETLRRSPASGDVAGVNAVY